MHGVGASFPIRLEIARKLYRSRGREPVEAVRDLSFSVAEGETVSLIGPSGAGKTTTLRILIGLDRDFEGRVFPDPDALRIGTVFQEPRLLLWRTVEENVRLALPRAERRRDLDALFEDLDLAAWRNRFPAELSGGMRRRVALARALAVTPALLVLDEPFVSLDDHAAAALRKVVRRVVEARKLAVILVTHNVREALGLSDRLLLLSARPARLLATIDLAAPRAERTPLWIEERRSELAVAYPETVAA